MNSGVLHKKEWLAPPQDLSLQADEVHAWRALLDLPDSQVDVLAGILSPDEISRAEKYRFRRDQKRFIARRGILRNILALYLGTGPAKIDFSYNPYGKPSLHNALSNSELSFNLSHTRDLALYAVGLKRRIGIDVEYPREELQWEEIAERFYSPHESEQLRALPEDDRFRLFFAYWTRKEAVLKARGMGLVNGLKDINVVLEPAAPQFDSHTEHRRYSVGNLELIGLNLGIAYVGALAVGGKGLHLQCWQWS